MYKKFVATVAALGTGLYVFAMPTFAAAVDKIDLCGTTKTAGVVTDVLCKFKLSGLLTLGIQAVLVVALVLAFVFLVIGGIKWIISGGDKAGTEAAKGTVTAALIGLIIVFLAWMFLNLITGLFGQTGQAFEIGSIKDVNPTQ